MMEIRIVKGNIFGSKADLVVLPCSEKLTVSALTEGWIQKFNLPRPEVVASRLRLGEVSPLVPTTIPQYGHIVYAASVLNDASSPEAIETIGRKTGRFVRNEPEH
jgi:hypothetical protein